MIIIRKIRTFFLSRLFCSTFIGLLLSDVQRTREQSLRYPKVLLSVK